MSLDVSTQSLWVKWVLKLYSLQEYILHATILLVKLVLKVFIVTSNI